MTTLLNLLLLASHVASGLLEEAAAAAARTALGHLARAPPAAAAMATSAEHLTARFRSWRLKAPKEHASARARRPRSRFLSRSRLKEATTAPFPAALAALGPRMSAPCLRCLRMIRDAINVLYSSTPSVPNYKSFQEFWRVKPS